MELITTVSESEEVTFKKPDTFDRKPQSFNDSDHAHPHTVPSASVTIPVVEMPQTQ